ncbi:hypothetical protein HYU19_00650 [Candidatus Woesearchaeota archaeon]|nr:hypothetical protein [Candidatus Woesearchaeota archaeon]
MADDLYILLKNGVIEKCPSVIRSKLPRYSLSGALQGAGCRGVSRAQLRKSKNFLLLPSKASATKKIPKIFCFSLRDAKNPEIFERPIRGRSAIKLTSRVLKALASEARTFQ